MKSSLHQAVDLYPVTVLAISGLFYGPSRLSSTENGHPSLLLNWEFPKRLCVPSVTRYGVKRSSLYEFSCGVLPTGPGG
ncbi:hypothetical protein AVEN_159905-1 [Araneus ventricosus]|uniref:Uncharacterized protein n=1 Tax=Araneus ventricosus TaxID=182803 RepID=A0A4Y2E2B8_ARAVE|nr:hypothetical protein AVEN_159905-1 [Araneus ventricosus]